MGSFARFLTSLLVTLPIAGYVAATLVANAPEDPGPQEPVVLRDPGRDPSTELDPRPAKGSNPADSAPSDAPSVPSIAPQPLDEEDDDVRVVTPAPTRVDDDDDGAGGADDDGSDDGPDDDEDDDESGDSEGGDD